MINIYAVELSSPMEESLFQLFLGFVGKKKEERIMKFLRREDAERSLVGDVLIRVLICDHLGLHNSDIFFSYNEFGKPSLEYDTAFDFNLSHSGKWVACAIDTSPLGIDVECIRDIDFSIAERFFSHIEYGDIMERVGNSRLEYFYDLWTLKESYIKARGMGLSIPLSSFTIRKENGSITCYSELEETWYFRQYNIDPDYKFSVCANNIKFPGDIIILNPSQLTEKWKS